jgi:hypothetical protein
MRNLIGSSIPANYFRGAEAVGGKLRFDETGMTFQSHSFNVSTGETRIEYSDILLIKERNTLGIVRNGISVFTENGFEHKFVVNGREEIIEFLTMQSKKHREK